MTPEGRVKADIAKILKQRGIWYFMPAANGFGKAGIPDFICCYKGLFLAVEAKAPGRLSTLTANQELRIMEIRAASGRAVAVESGEQLIKFLNSDFGSFTHGDNHAV